MDTGLGTAIVIGLAVVLACIRLGYRHFRTQPRAPGWRVAALLALQPVCGVLLYLTLLPPALSGLGDSLTVVTRGADQMPAGSGASRVALPEATRTFGAERVPDLATALRRYPGTRRLSVLGDGLEQRDRDAATGLGVDFVAAQVPPGLVELNLPARTAPGASFDVTGRVIGTRGSVELTDPAGRRVDARPIPATGEFVVSGTARIPGHAEFKLDIRDAQRRIVEQIEVPSWTAGDPPPSVFVLGGAPSPELKYLQRWMSDAGMKVHSQLSVGGGERLGDPPLPLTAGTLQRFDLLLLDERSLQSLGAAERAAVVGAVRGGLGLLVHLSGPLSDAARGQLQALGLNLAGGADTAMTTLPQPAADAAAVRARRGPGTTDAPAGINTASDTPAELTRRVVRTDPVNLVPLVRGADGTVLSAWRSVGRGRVGIMTVVDSFRLVLAGQDDRYEGLWSRFFAVLSRPRAKPVDTGDLSFAGQRTILCGLTNGARVTAGGRVADLHVAATGCAAYWPRNPGWHILRTGVKEADGRPVPFYVFAAEALPGVRAFATREATLQLRREADAQARSPMGQPIAGRASPWPWFIGLLAALGTLWWLERARLVRSSIPRLFRQSSGL